jgi:hypothetical protein
MEDEASENRVLERQCQRRPYATEAIVKGNRGSGRHESRGGTPNGSKPKLVPLEQIPGAREILLAVLSGKGLAQCRTFSVRLQPLPIRTAREVFPQAAHPVSFVERVMLAPMDDDCHERRSTPGRGRRVQSQYSPSTP